MKNHYDDRRATNEFRKFLAYYFKGMDGVRELKNQIYSATTTDQIIELIDNTLFVRVYNKGLLFAEAMEVSSDADIIHILQRLNNIYDIYNMYARALGDTERITRICKRCFKHIDK